MVSLVTTIKDIAKKSGVSIATVSRVINGVGGYSKEVEQKVLLIAKELNYRKNENAISLVKNKTNTLGIIMPDLPTSFYRDIVNGIEHEAYLKDYSVILTHAGVGGDRFKESLNLMAERRVDGIVVFSLFLDQKDVETIKLLKIPIVLLSTEATDSSIPFIKVDDYSASFAAVNYLIEKGHTDIGLAGVSSKDPVAGLPRIKGYKDALINSDLRIDEELIEFGDFTFEAGKQAMYSYLSNEKIITAVFCVSDETALGVISVCYEKGIKVPEDISVIGYDNSTISYMSTPPITTVDQPFYEMGRLGCKDLLKIIHENKEVKSRIVPFQLVERKSVRDLA